MNRAANGKRIRQEMEVIETMIGIYCRKHHAGVRGELCGECRELLEYARTRLERCPKGERKSSCRKCEIHCYSPLYRHRIKEVMRYVGPRMILVHPMMAIRHMINEL